MTTTDVEAQLAAILGDVKREIDISQRTRIFCNRNLRMDSIDLIGFDMDYTLALYQQESMEGLAIKLTLDKLIEDCGYPEAIRDLNFAANLAIRGTVVDMELGNVFKMDRHGHVGRVYHGRRELNKEERRQQYRNSRINLSEPSYKWIDTLFGLPEAVMFVALVDFYDKQEEKPTYRQIFTDIRASIDKAHSDDTLKSAIKADLQKYVYKDERLAEMIHKLRSSGKKTFLLTNSYYAYTREVMSYLLDGARKAYPSWRNYFDVVIVGGKKPGFFAKNVPFIALDPESGEEQGTEVKQLSRDKIYQGGNINDFERMTGISGERVLYIGDHIYGDILKLKRSHMWRTAMVIQELDGESATAERVSGQIRDLGLLDRRRRNLASEIDYEVTMLKRLQKIFDDVSDPDLAPRLEEAKALAKKSLGSLRDRHRLMVEEVQALEANIERAYNPYWGAMFREGNENSRFGEQVSDYADLYTSRASNFVYYSPLRYFRAPRRQMPHEV